MKLLFQLIIEANADVVVLVPPEMITVRIKMYPPCREYSTKRAKKAAMENIR